MASHLLLLELGHGGCNFSRHGLFMRLSLSWPSSAERSITITVSTNQRCCYNNFEIQSRYVVTKFYVNNMIVYICDIHEIKKHAQVKAILTFTIESQQAATFSSIISTPFMPL